eukprot:420285-Prymnesium_polylepis.2
MQRKKTKITAGRPSTIAWSLHAGNALDSVLGYLVALFCATLLADSSRLLITPHAAEQVEMTLTAQRGPMAFRYSRSENRARHCSAADQRGGHLQQHQPPEQQIVNG